MYMRDKNHLIFSNNYALSTYNTLVLKRFAYVLSQFIPTTI